MNTPEETEAERRQESVDYFLDLVEMAKKIKKERPTLGFGDCMRIATTKKLNKPIIEWEDGTYVLP